MTGKKNGQIKKEALDQYFTPQEDAENYAAWVVSTFGTGSKYLEPTAGGGVFVDALVKEGVPRENILAVDLDPKRSDILEKDVFSFGEEIVNRIVIGNLPFGKGGSMAIRIMNHLSSCGVKTMCLLNPICIGHKHFTLKALSRDLVLGVSLEFEKGKHFTYLTDHDTSKPNPVRCEFQIWIRGQRRETKFTRENDEIIILQPGTKKFINESGKNCELPVGEIDADFTITSHGMKSGTIKDFSPNQKANVNMFIKVKDGYNKEEIRSKLEVLDLKPLTEWSTISHNPSIAPTELIEFLENK